jgi:hypothetical protein
MQEFEFCGGQAHLLRLAQKTMPGHVQNKRSKQNVSAFATRRSRQAPCSWRPPHQRTQPRQQLARTKRLGHVVVGAHLQSNHPVRFFAASGQHEDGHRPLCLDAADE